MSAPRRPRVGEARGRAEHESSSGSRSSRISEFGASLVGALSREAFTTRGFGGRAAKRRRLSSSRRVVAAVVLLGSILFAAVFAEFVASSAPVVAVHQGQLLVLPAVFDADQYATAQPAEIAARHAGDLAIWPLVRFGAETPSPDGALAGPSLTHPFGTDALARDVLARIVHGARTALGLAFAAVAFGLALGTLAGAAAGLFGGVVDATVARVVETVDTFPAIVVVALVRAALGEPGAIALVVVVGGTRAAETARLVRAEVIRASSSDYVHAARALGVTPLRALVRHLLPNAANALVTSVAFGVASCVLLESALAFLGIGLGGAAASWGDLIAQGALGPRPSLRVIAMPGLALVATVASLYLLGDAVQTLLDPRSRRVPLKRPARPSAPAPAPSPDRSDDLDPGSRASTWT